MNNEDIDNHPLEKIKQQNNFDEDIAKMLAEGAGKTSDFDAEKLLEQVKIEVDSGMRDVADGWKRRDEDD